MDEIEISQLISIVMDELQQLGRATISDSEINFLINHASATMSQVGRIIYLREKHEDESNE